LTSWKFSILQVFIVSQCNSALFFFICMKKKSKIKIWRWIILILIIYFFWKIFLSPIYLNKTVTIEQGDNFQKFASNLSKFEQFRIRLYLLPRKNRIDLSKIQIWNYEFSWSYSPSSFIKLIQSWSQTNYIRYTVLEWRSIYDIDYYLSQKWYIKTWEYISFVTDPVIIGKYINRYEFLQKTNKNLTSLEWSLYPDTYHIDRGQNFIDQLVYLQLDAFNNKVWKNIEDQINNFPLPWNDMIILSSILEKEEKNPDNKPIVAWIFLKRINNGIKLDADITLCYGLKQAYEFCKPDIIAKNIDDKNNIFNTRQNRGLTPSPIWNPSYQTINAVLNYKDSEYLFYLHDNNGIIHYGRTIQEHNTNKQIYLN